MKGVKYQLFIAKNNVENTVLKCIWWQDDIHGFSSVKGLLVIINEKTECYRKWSNLEQVGRVNPLKEKGVLN